MSSGSSFHPLIFPASMKDYSVPLMVLRPQTIDAAELVVRNKVANLVNFL